MPSSRREMDAAVTLRLLLNDLISPRMRTNSFVLRQRKYALELVHLGAFVRRVVDPLAHVELACAVVERVRDIGRVARNVLDPCDKRHLAQLRIVKGKGRIRVRLRRVEHLANRHGAQRVGADALGEWGLRTRPPSWLLFAPPKKPPVLPPPVE